MDHVELADWTVPTIDSWRHSIWVGVWDPWIVVFKVRLWREGGCGGRAGRAASKTRTSLDASLVCAREVITHNPPSTQGPRIWYKVVLEVVTLAIMPHTPLPLPTQSFPAGPPHLVQDPARDCDPGAHAPRLCRRPDGGGLGRGCWLSRGQYQGRVGAGWGKEAQAHAPRHCRQRQGGPAGGWVCRGGWVRGDCGLQVGAQQGRVVQQGIAKRRLLLSLSAVSNRLLMCPAAPTLHFTLQYGMMKAKKKAA